MRARAGPEYRNLGRLRRDYPNVPMMALTATATEATRDDIIATLGMVDAVVVTASLNRENLSYQVRQKGSNVVKDIANLIRTEYDGESGIIYCRARASCEEVAQKLRNDYKIRAAFYHAGSPDDERSRVQRAWKAGEVDVMVATTACVDVSFFGARAGRC